MKKLGRGSILRLRLMPIVAILIVTLSVGTIGAVSADGGQTDLTVTFDGEWFFLSWADWDNPQYATQALMVVRVREVGVSPVAWTEFYVGNWRAAEGHFPLRLDDTLDSGSEFELGGTYKFRIATWNAATDVVTDVSDELTVVIPLLDGTVPEPAVDVAPVAATPEPTAAPAVTTTPAPATQTAVAATPAQASAPAVNPRKPHGLGATQANGAVTLTWTPGTNPKFVKQEVRRREPGQPWVVLAEVGTDAATWTDATVESGKEYIYRVFARKANNKGPMSYRVKLTAE